VPPTPPDYSGSWDDPQFSEGAGDNNFYFRTHQDMTNRTTANRIFTQPAAGTFVKDRVRNILYHPGFQNWNAGLFKNFGITENQRIQFRAEAFNFLNHPNWNNADTNPNSNTFGKVTAKSSERQLQLSLRYTF
jgi:hypothetical protein